MDGACFGAFIFITAKFPWIHCFICPPHSIDGFMKNVCSDKAVIRIKRDPTPFPWGEDIFSAPINKVKRINIC